MSDIKVPDGKYSVGVDLGSGSDKSAVSIIQRGENGEPDKEVATVTWEEDGLANAFLKTYRAGQASSDAS